jgi:hypothetical protein
MRKDRDDNVVDLSDKQFEKHSERVRAAGGTPVRQGRTKFGGLWSLDHKKGGEFDLLLALFRGLQGDDFNPDAFIKMVKEQPGGIKWLRARGVIE